MIGFDSQVQNKIFLQVFTANVLIAPIQVAWNIKEQVQDYKTMFTFQHLEDSGVVSSFSFGPITSNVGGQSDFDFHSLKCFLYGSLWGFSPSFAIKSFFFLNPFLLER